jgi:DNA-binding transcriptional LysR family regulator
LDRTDLELLVALDDHGSLTAAAADLHTAQPALSRRLARLERRLGTTLFDRGRFGTAPTGAGRAVTAAARTALDAIAEVEQTGARAAAGMSGTLRAGTTPTLGSDLLPPTLAAFRAHRPEVRLELVSSGNSSALRRHVVDGELDLAVAVVPPVLEAGLVAEPTGVQPFALVAPADHPLAESARATRESLREVPVVALARSEGLRLVLDALFAEMGAEPEIAIETTEREMLIPFVTAGLGVALVPATFAHQRAGAGTRVLDLDPPLHRRVGVFRRAGNDDPLVQAFVELVDLSP